MDLAAIYDGVVPLTQDSLASMAGTTRPTTNGVLQGLVKDGIVRLGRGRFQVLDPDALAARAR